MPDVKNASEETAVAILVKNEFIPITEYEYSNSIETGKVIRTSPMIGSELEKNSSIIIYVSKGAKKINSIDSRMSLYNISGIAEFKLGEWGFYTPYIDDETLYIDIYLKFSTSKSIKWNNPQEQEYGIGTAIIVDENNKQVPFTIQYDRDIVANTSYQFTAKLPLNDLTNKKPTNINFITGIMLNDVYKELKFDTTISW